MQAQVHIDEYPIGVKSSVNLGITVLKTDGDWSKRLATVVAIRDDSGMPRLVYSEIRRLTWDHHAFISKLDPLVAADAILALSYSAHERLIRTYHKPLGGEFEATLAMSVNEWGVAPGEPLELRILGFNQAFAPAIGQFYIERLIYSPHALFVPEPGMAWSVAITLLWVRSQRRHALALHQPV